MSPRQKSPVGVRQIHQIYRCSPFKSGIGSVGVVRIQTTPTGNHLGLMVLLTFGRRCSMPYKCVLWWLIVDCAEWTICHNVWTRFLFNARLFSFSFCLFHWTTHPSHQKSVVSVSPPGATLIVLGADFQVGVSHISCGLIRAFWPFLIVCCSLGYEQQIEHLPPPVAVMRGFFSSSALAAAAPVADMTYFVICANSVTGI